MEAEYLDENLALDVIKEAQSWVNTPFEHQGQIKGRGVDCVHFVDNCLITVVGEKLGLDVKIPNNYNPRTDGSLMLKMLDTLLDFIPTDERKLGDIVAFTDPDLHDPNRPSHLAFISEVTPVTTYIIEAGRRGVVRHRLDGIWMRRIHSCWRINTQKLRAYQAGEMKFV